MIWGMIKAFISGGVLCAIGQVLLDKTNIAAARILVIYVVAGVVLGAIGVYGPFAEWAGAGAAIPLTGFGNALAEGIKKAIGERGVMGIMTGGLTAAAGGTCAAIFFGYVVALLSRPKEKE